MIISTVSVQGIVGHFLILPPVRLPPPPSLRLQFDNLYIDMNGIIHPCSHPEDKPPPASEEEMYKNVMDYVDR